MARSTFSCCHVSLDRLLSMKSLPCCRMMSATSRVGRFISYASCVTGERFPGWRRSSYPAGWEQPADAGEKGAGNVQVDHRVFEFYMAEQELNGAQVGACFQQVSCVGMSKQVGVNA